MPITPKGTRTLLILRPLGRVKVSMISPMGSSSAAIWRSPSAMAAILVSVRARRSKSPSCMPFSFPAFISFSLAERISSVWESKASDACSSALFFSVAVNFCRVYLAFRACAPISFNIISSIPIPVLSVSQADNLLGFYVIWFFFNIVYHLAVKAYGNGMQSLFLL